MTSGRSHYASRPATPEDLDFVRRLHHETLRPCIERTSGWDEAAQDDFVEKWFKPHRTRIIQRGEEDIGLLVVQRKEDELLLESISIVAASQGDGIGSAVVNDVLAEARASNLPVVLQVLQVNSPARRLYERLGFRVVGETPTHLRMEWRPPG